MEKVVVLDSVFCCRRRNSKAVAVKGEQSRILESIIFDAPGS